MWIYRQRVTRNIGKCFPFLHKLFNFRETRFNKIILQMEVLLNLAHKAPIMGFTTAIYTNPATIKYNGVYSIPATATELQHAQNPPSKSWLNSLTTESSKTWEEKKEERKMQSWEREGCLGERSYAAWPKFPRERIHGPCPARHDVKVLPSSVVRCPAAGTSDVIAARAGSQAAAGLAIKASSWLLAAFPPVARVAAVC